MNFKAIALILSVALAASCGGERSGTPGRQAPSALSQVPAVQLNYRYEADVPAPETVPPAKDERIPAIQANFDQNRSTEIVDRMILSPDGKRVAVVYHRPEDQQMEFRLDIYSPEGQPIRKVTSDLMALHFPDTIRWAPDSSALAFVAMLRGVPEEPTPTPEGGTGNTPAASPSPSPSPAADAVNENSNSASAEQPPASDGNQAADPNNPPPAATPEAPTGILTFRTEQLYICGPDGDNTRPITQNEGFIYYYYVWSPDSTMLAALAVHTREWRELERRADATGAMFVPAGRPRIVEKNGRERRLDDALTIVQPVWSPDSSKVAAAYEHQVRIYDAGANSPTQAGIPLRNQLLLSSQAYDRTQAQQLSADGNQNTANANTAPNTLPDPSTLASFNPIVLLNWPSPDLLYFETAYIRRMKNEADSATSFLRWHRLALSPQAAN